MSQHAIIHGDLDSPPEEQPEQPVEPDDEFEENLIPERVEAPFVEGLAALLTVLRDNPALVESVSHIAQTRSAHLELRVFTDWDVTALHLWALTLTDISTIAYRYDDSVFGEISGLLGDARVRIVGLIPVDSVPEGAGAHEWTLPEVTS